LKEVSILEGDPSYLHTQKSELHKALMIDTH